MPEEHVLVVPTKLFRGLGYFQGFKSDIDRYRNALLAPENVRFMPRSEAEKNPEYKQLIPYMIFCHTDENRTVRLFQYVRGKGMGESRLHRKRSVGVGGHISSTDLASPDSHADVYREGMCRELEEEVVLGSTYTQSCVGMINDDETEVGTVHLGIVHRFDLAEPKVESNEPDLIESGFMTIGEMLSDLSGFESWSSICLEALWGTGSRRQ